MEECIVSKGLLADIKVVEATGIGPDSCICMLLQATDVCSGSMYGVK